MERDRTSSGRPKAEGGTYPPPTRAGATVWQVTTDRPHTIELEVSLLTGREIVVLDGRELVNAANWTSRSEHQVPLGNQQGVLTVSMGLGGLTASLRVEGREVAPVKTATFVQPRSAAPTWAYAFGVACCAIPVVTLGGAIPAGLGVGAAAACMAVARNEKMPVGARVGVCALITVAAWGLLGLLGLVVLRSRGAR